MENQSKRSKKCCYCPFYKLFLLQLFEIGNSAGSLIGECINLLRTFQRLSATRTFITKFPSESQGMFSWATDLVKIVISSFQIKPLSDIELFWLYTNAIPLWILVLITSLCNGIKQYRYFIFWVIFILIGYGISSLFIDPLFSIIYLAMGGGLLLFYIMLYFCCLKRKWAEFDKNTSTVLELQNNYQFTYAVCASFCIFTGLLIPILLVRKILTILWAVIVGLILIISFIVEAKEHCCHKHIQQTHFQKYSSKIIAFLISCLSLLIIPSTNNFIGLMKGLYEKKWNIIIGYIIVTLLFPIVTTFFMIKTNYSEVCNKYKEPKSQKCNSYSYIELVDIIKQVAYAIVAAFDLPIACIVIEAIWFVLIIIVRPYKNVSDYSLSFGSSLVMFLSNGGAVYSNKKGTGFFTFKITVIFIIIACIPAIISAYLFFIFDFNTQVDDSSNSEKINDDNLRAVMLISSFTGPVVCFILGVTLNEIIDEKVI